MEIDFAIYAEAAELTETGRFHIFGGGTNLFYGPYPGVVPLSLAMRIVFPHEECEREYPVKVETVDAEGVAPWPAFETTFHPTKPIALSPISVDDSNLKVAVNLVVRGPIVMIPKSGQYFTRIWVGDGLLKEIGLLAAEAPTPQPPAQQEGSP